MASFVESRDRRVFERLFKRYRGPMVAYAGRYVKSPAHAEELAQEIFVRVYKTKTYTPDATFKTWLYRVATNVCLNEVRRHEHKQQFSPIHDEHTPEPTAPASASPQAQLEGRDLSTALGAALSALPSKQRAAFIMVRVEGMRHDEVAEALDSSVSAVKSLVHRALSALRKHADEVVRHD